MNELTLHEREFTVQRQLGLHARPASQFVILAGCFKSEISVGRGKEWVDGRLVKSDAGVTGVRAVGADAVEAVEALGELLEASPEMGDAEVYPNESG